MATCKNTVFKICLLMFIMESVYCPRLNKDHKECRDNIYREYDLLGIKEYKTKRDREQILSKSFKSKLFSCLKNKDAQEYYMYVHDNITITDDMGRDTPRQYCERIIIENYDSCFDRLQTYFLDSDDIKKVMQNAYLTWLESEFIDMLPDDYAKRYYYYLVEYIDFDKNMQSPFGFCRHLVKTIGWINEKKRNLPDSGFDIENESSKMNKNQTVSNNDNVINIERT